MMNEQDFADFVQNHEALNRFGERYRADAALRARLAGGDYADLDAAGLDAAVPAGMEVRVLQETPDTKYCPLPPDPNSQLGDRALEGIAGGTSDRGSGVSTVGSAGSIGCLPSTVSSVSSASTSNLS